MKYIVLYGLTVGVGQFACLFYAMQIGVPAGIASIVLQIQAFISPVLAMIFLNENLSSKQIVGFVVAAAGLGLIATASAGDNINKIPPIAFILMLAAPAFWAVSNIVAKIASDKATAKDEKETLLNVLANLNGISIFAVFYLAFAATLTSYGIWSILVAKYPMSTVAPIPLLVPIVALISARIVLNEQLSPMQWTGFIIILAGLVISNVNFKLIKNIFVKSKIS